MTALLERLESTDQGTFGRLIIDDLILFTGELPWRDNRSNISCIPPGIYNCLWTYSPAFKRMMYLVDAVSGRAGIRIHSANLMGDRSRGYRAQLYGCIALGEKLGTIDGQKALLISKPAVRRLEQKVGYQPFKLEIRQHGVF